MRVLVTVKEVAVVDDDFDVRGQHIDDGSISYELNEWDDCAVEEALQLAEEDDEVEVVVATVGPERSEETIREVLAKGADRAVRVWDERLAERSVLGPVTTAKLLAGVVSDESPDLVLAGAQSGDDAYGATGVALARAVDYAWAAVVSHLSLADDYGSAAVRREVEGGVEELTDVELPAVLSLQTGINDPRYADLRGIREAQSKPLDVRTPDDLGVAVDTLGADLSLGELYEPVSESDVTVLEGGPGETAAQLNELLADKGVLDG